MLCSQIMDELMAKYEYTKMVPIPWYVRQIYQMAKARKAHLLWQKNLQYVIQANTGNLETALENSTWKSQGDWDRDRQLLLALARKVNGNSHLLTYPLKKTACANYHLH
jgi:hypothetical protein